MKTLHLIIFIFGTLVSYSQTRTEGNEISREDSMKIVNAVLKEILVKNQQRQQMQIDSLKTMVLELEYQILLAKSIQKQAELQSLKAEERARRASSASDEISSRSDPVYVSVNSLEQDRLQKQIRELVHQRDSVQHLLLDQNIKKEN